MKKYYQAIVVIRNQLSWTGNSIWDPMDAWNNFVEGAGNMINDAGKGIEEGWNNTVKGAENMVKDAGEAIDNTVKGAESAIKDAGKAIEEGLDNLKNVPGLGNVIKAVELIALISAKLAEVEAILLAIRVEGPGEAEEAVNTALLKSGLAMTACYAVAADPEPLSRTTLALAAVAAINDLPPTLKTAVKSVENEKNLDDIKKKDLRGRFDELDDLIRKLRKETQI